jgi:hypothetical protein
MIDELVTIEVRRSDVCYLLETERPFYRNCEESKRILDAIRRALANGRS